MKPVQVGKGSDTISLEAAGIVAFGGAVVWSAAGTVKAAITGNDNAVIGFADMNEVGTKNPGFYSTYEPVPIIVDVGRRINVWVVANGSDVDVSAGDFLEVAAMGSSPQGTHGVLEEAGSTAGGTRVTSAVAKAVEDATMGAASYQVPSSVAIGDETVTFASAANKTSINLSEGGYIILEDLNDDLQINRALNVGKSTTVIDLQRPSTTTLTSGNSDLVTKCVQCAAVIA